jgi:hypothetical protein
MMRFSGLSGGDNIPTNPASVGKCFEQHVSLTMGYGRFQGLQILSKPIQHGQNGLFVG